MGLFDSLLEGAIHLATSPLDVVKDVVTLGGALTGEDSAIAGKLEKLGRDATKISNSSTIF